ncbi:MAG: 2-hydroxyacid dehydrogenase, partial [Proteobacteria bacterium]|nr:2-hydroxyacid dehydrogenase [Pseudomonadota bacterium]
TWAEVLIPEMLAITAEMIAAGNLRLIQQYGVGLEGVDIEAATRAGVPVCNVPGAIAPDNAESTAEHAVFLMMACARKLNECRRTMSQGPWGSPLGRALFGHQALIVGLGQVGRGVARRLRAFGVRVMATKARPDAELARELGLERLGGPDELIEMLGQADFVVSTVTANPATIGIFDQDLFVRMKPGAVFVNVSRGAVVDETALIGAIESGHLGGAGLDVFGAEPPPADHPLFGMERVVVTPHIAGVTEQSHQAIGRVVAENIERLRDGRPLLHQANQV